MKELQRLVKAIDTYGPTINPLLNLQDDGTLEAKLFNLLKDDKVVSDGNIAQELYGNSNNASGFRMLKSRFRKKLFNHLHFLNLPDEMFSIRAFYEQQCMSLLQEARCLVTISELRLADKHLEQVLVISEKYELVDFTIRALEIKQRVCTMLGLIQKYNEQDTKLLQARAKYEAEQEAIRIYQLFIIKQNTSVDSRNNLLERYPETLQKLYKLWGKVNSSAIYSFYHILRINYQELIGNYENIVQAIKDAEELYFTGKLNEAWYNQKFNAYMMVYSLLQTKQYREGLATAEAYTNYFVPNTLNWFGFMENYLLLALHAKKYSLGIELLNRVFANKHFTKISEGTKERLEVVRRYIILLHKSYKLERELDYKKSFQDHLTILPKDKSGFNLALLVLDVLEKLADGQADELEAQAERVRKYSQKYLKGEKAERPRLFMRLLLLALTKQNADNAREQGQQLLERLQAAPLPGDAFTEVEIVPYEHLWELALELLERQGS